MIHSNDWMLYFDKKWRRGRRSFIIFHTTREDSTLELIWRTVSMHLFELTREFRCGQRQSCQWPECNYSYNLVLSCGMERRCLLEGEGRWLFVQSGWCTWKLIGGCETIFKEIMYIVLFVLIFQRFQFECILRHFHVRSMLLAEIFEFAGGSLASR